MEGLPYRLRTHVHMGSDLYEVYEHLYSLALGSVPDAAEGEERAAGSICSWNSKWSVLVSSLNRTLVLCIIKGLIKGILRVRSSFIIKSRKDRMNAQLRTDAPV